MFPNPFSDKILKHFSKNAKFVVGFSGGPDSVFLATHFLKNWKPENLFLAHFNHDLRKNAERDAQFCRDFAAKNGVEIVVEKWKNPQKSEKKARDARNAFLENVRAAKNADAIALGTHFDDSVETIFFNFVRGTGVRGLSGIAEFCERRRKFRPLLDLKKSEILTFLKNEKIPFCVDETNLENDFARNFLRNLIFPKLEKKFPFFKKNLFRQRKIFAEIADFLEKSADDFLKKIPEIAGEKRFLKRDFEKLPAAVKREICRKILQKKISFEKIDAILDFLKTGKSGKKMIFGGVEILISEKYFFVKNLFFKKNEK